MLPYLAKRLGGLVLVLVVMSFIVFCLQAIIPADPARALAGPSAPVETVDRIRAELGLDQPLLVQYGQFMSRLAEGDLGTSIRTRQPIAADVLKSGPASLELIVFAMLLGTGFAFLLAFAQTTHDPLGRCAPRHARGRLVPDLPHRAAARLFPLVQARLVPRQRTPRYPPLHRADRLLRPRWAVAGPPRHLASTRSGTWSCPASRCRCRSPSGWGARSTPRSST